MPVKIRVAGVDEHFNSPWHIGIKNGAFLDQGVEIEWITAFGGTGEMTRLLRDGDADICVLLTEGIITDMINGNPSKIIGSYIQSPLTWGVHSGVNNQLEEYDASFSGKYAISRKGSGSHLMPIVDAITKGKKIDPEQFVIVGGLQHALESLSKLETDVFYWEKFTTKPFVDSGILKRIGEYNSPWPCFMIAASDEALKDKKDEIKTVLNSIYSLSEKFMRSGESINYICNEFDLKKEDAEYWFYSTEWALNDHVSYKMIDNVQYFLLEAGIIDGSADPTALCYKL